MATPLIAGPGALASMILLAGHDGGSLPVVLGVHLVMLGVLALVFVLCLGAGLLERVLGHTGVNVVTRLLGMLLAALSVQFVLDGLADFGLVTGG
jgi:multiple antibiotic resistance protein